METKKEPIYKRIKGHVGRPPKFETAADLLDKLFEYCEYCDANPIKMNERSKMKRSSDKGDASELGNVQVQPTATQKKIIYPTFKRLFQTP